MTADESIEQLVGVLLRSKPAWEARLVPSSISSEIPGEYPPVTTPAITAEREGSRGPSPSELPLTANGAPLRTLSDDIERLVMSKQTQVDTLGTASPTKEGSGGSTLTGVGKTLALATGIGPLAAGLLELFGGGDESADSSPERSLWSQPARLDVEAALDVDRNLKPISYSSQGNIRVASTQNQRSAASLPPIQVNVSAMDSRSFLEHSDDIARAVREALLQSSQLSDVISEL